MSFSRQVSRSTFTRCSGTDPFIIIIFLFVVGERVVPCLHEEGTTNATRDRHILAAFTEIRENIPGCRRLVAQQC